MMNCLMWFGNTTILLMAGMMGIDTSLFEAAEVDGATSTQVFFKITLPLLRPILVYVIITSLIGGLQLFDVPQILTNGTGDPMRSTMTLIMYLNKHLFSKNYGMAGAVMDSVSGRMFLAAPVDPEDLEDIASARSNILWDSRKGGISALDAVVAVDELVGGEPELRRFLLLADLRPRPVDAVVRAHQRKAHLVGAVVAPRPRRIERRAALRLVDVVQVLDDLHPVERERHPVAGEAMERTVQGHRRRVGRVQPEQIALPQRHSVRAILLDRGPIVVLADRP